MWTVGLDVHQSCSSVCVLDEKGNRIREQEVRGGWDRLVEELAKLKEPFQVCYEASTGYGALYERLAPLASEVAVAHLGKLRLIFQSKKKSNRVDAAKLAALLHLNQVPRVHVPRQEVRSWRGLIEHRRRLVDKSAMVKNQVRALLRGHGIKGAHRASLWTKSGIRWLRELSWPTMLEKLRMEVMLEELAEVRKRRPRRRYAPAALDAMALECFLKLDKGLLIDGTRERSVRGRRTVRERLVLWRGLWKWGRRTCRWRAGRSPHSPR